MRDRETGERGHSTAQTGVYSINQGRAVVGIVALRLRETGSIPSRSLCARPSQSTRAAPAGSSACPPSTIHSTETGPVSSSITKKNNKKEERERRRERGETATINDKHKSTDLRITTIQNHKHSGRAKKNLVANGCLSFLSRKWWPSYWAIITRQ